jgi:hypothetical protein
MHITYIIHIHILIHMHTHLFPDDKALRKRTNKLRMEANTLAMESAQLKSAASRMQRQEYR